MGIIVSFILAVIAVLIAKKFFYFMEKEDFSFSKAIGAALVTWVLEIPKICKNLYLGIEEGFKYLKKGE